MFIPLKVIFLSFVTFSWIASSSATSFFQVPFKDQVSQGDKIVRAEVRSSEAKVAKGVDGIERIYTYTTLRVTEVLKGKLKINSSNQIQARQLGGEAGGRGLVVSGTAHFDTNEDTVVILGDQNPDGSYEVRGMSMGKFRVSVVEGEERLEGGSLDSTGGHFVPSEGQRDTVPKQWTLRELRELIASQQGAPTSATPVPSTSSRPSSTAPSLQNPSLGPAERGEPGKSERVSSLLWFLGVGGVLGVLGWGVFRRRRPK